MLQEDGVEIVRVQGRLDGPRRVTVVSNNNNNGTQVVMTAIILVIIVIIIVMIIAVHLQGVSWKSCRCIEYWK
jgi:hypothetical protein